MSAAILRDQARGIMRQRIAEAEDARLVRRMRAHQMTRLRIKKAMSLGMRNGIPMDEMVLEVTAAYAQRGWAETK